MNQKNLLFWFHEKKRKTNYSINVTTRLAKLTTKIRMSNTKQISILDANLNRKWKKKMNN